VTAKEESREMNNLPIDISSRPRHAKGGTRKISLNRQRLPLVSVIVVAFQDRDEVAALIDNIATFRGDDLELVVIDGGSDDGTLELLQSRNSEVDYWLSEPDRGIYDAMNKGIAAARGEYVLHLNAGDRLLLDPVVELAACSREKVDVASFRVRLDGDAVHVPGRSFMKITNVWHHQGTLYRRAAHLGYDTTYRVFGDFDHNQRMAKATSSVRIFDSVLSSHKNAGLSGNKKHFREVYRSIRQNSGLLYIVVAFLQFKINGLRNRISNFTHQTKWRNARN
jgi:glycosyltransferase involved in cell wall biosynthesis